MSAAHDIYRDWPGEPSIALIDQIDQGLPLAELDRLAARVAPGDKTFKYQFVTRPTYARRKAQGPTARMSSSESATLVRFARVWEWAVKVWGSEEKARDFLGRKHMLLQMRTPLSVILSGETGGQMVYDLLGRFYYGSAI